MPGARISHVLDILREDRAKRRVATRPLHAFPDMLSRIMQVEGSQVAAWEQRQSFCNLKDCSNSPCLKLDGPGTFSQLIDLFQQIWCSAERFGASLQGPPVELCTQQKLC